MIDINFQPCPKLITERLYLRQLKVSDANEIFLLRSNDSVNAFINRQKAASVVEADAFITRISTMQANNEAIMWAIVRKGFDQLIGTIGIWNFEIENAQAEIGFEMLPQHQGNGLMFEALTSTINFAFKNLLLNKIVANARQDNQRSIKLLEKCSFIKSDERDGEYISYKLSR